MAGRDLKQELSELIQSCKNKGLLGDYFDHVQSLQDDDEPKFVTKIITLFIEQADKDIAEITKLMSEPDYDQVKFLADRIYSSNLGRCLESLEVLKREYQIMKESLNDIVEMERRIFDEEV
ncbi:histidine-containing phosphotransfer protein 1-like [Argentina anserina]|uniref:histidine-containing phosphotransfer protein 1-like n=1 Tax=Argentina anserina TaxID=57926 RepID=UPI0021762649|nr:histidine-containing phosphotransfer protein 1-like [Potentilla anserina]